MDDFDLCNRVSKIGYALKFRSRWSQALLALGDIRSGELFDYSRVQQHFSDLADRPPEDICAQMWQAGEHWSAGHPQDDDVTLVAFKIK